MNGRLPLLLLIAGCALFGAILFRELTAPDEADAQAVAVAPRPTTAPAPLRPPSENVEAMLTTTLARPLFSPNRRPTEKSNDNGATGGLGDSRLTGIITLPQHGIAIFAMPGTKPLIVSEGDSVSGWRIDAITPEEVSVTGPDGAKTLKPKSDPALAIAAAAAPPRLNLPGLAAPRPVPVQMPRPLNAVQQPLRPGLPMAPGFHPVQR